MSSSSAGNRRKQGRKRPHRQPRNEASNLIALPVRDLILDTAKSLVSGERAAAYGAAHDNFSRIGALWAPILGVEVTPEQVAMCMVQVKIARLCNSPDHVDSWVDVCGFGSLGAEVSQEDPRTPDSRQAG